nr:TPA_asm: m139.5 sORF [Murid betaherpesvirus 1]DBA07912.1 TPA_asm: m139.5 sORF [Murid betaherpesvirus 1]
MTIRPTTVRGSSQHTMPLMSTPFSSS